MYSTEITAKEWYGAQIPKWLRVFDCRGDETPKGPNGISIFASEKAAYDLGLRSATDTDWHDGTPLSQSTNWDARTAPPEELKRQVTDMVKAAKQLMRLYKKNLNSPPGPGVGYEKVVAVALSNFGWCVITDKRFRSIKPFTY
jgi:hypothetical protein